MCKEENGYVATPFSSQNGFLSELKKRIKNQKKFVLIASDPFDYQMNDVFLELDKQALKLSGLEFEEYFVVDDRNKDQVKTLLDQASLALLA